MFFSREHRLMQEAIDIARWSEDKSIQNGAVVVRGGLVVGHGVNNMPEGVERTDERLERPLKYAYTEHAERAAIFDAAKHGERFDGAEMYSPWAACSDCARAIGMVGIKTLVRLEMPDNERWNESVAIGDQILKEMGVEVVEMHDEGLIVAGVRLGNYA